jgi:hypothetical protein
MLLIHGRNKDYFSELCAEDMNANSVNPGIAVVGYGYADLKTR